MSVNLLVTRVMIAKWNSLNTCFHCHDNFVYLNGCLGLLGNVQKAQNDPSQKVVHTMLSNVNNTFRKERILHLGNLKQAHFSSISVFWKHIWLIIAYSVQYEHVL